MIDLDEVLAFATEAHTGQLRKYTGDDYIVHPIAVSELVKIHGGSLEQQAAALLHDTVEDCDVTLDDIEKEFGTDIASLVYWLTDTSKPEDGNRAIRKAIDAERLGNAPVEAQFVKVADLIDNTKSIVEFDSSFAKVYLREKSVLLSKMTKVHDSSLFTLAYHQLEMF